jgi:hypothetical protein
MPRFNEISVAFGLHTSMIDAERWSSLLSALRHLYYKRQKCASPLHTIFWLHTYFFLLYIPSNLQSTRFPTIYLLSVCALSVGHTTRCPTAEDCHNSIQQALLDGNALPLQDSYEDYITPSPCNRDISFHPPIQQQTTMHYVYNTSKQTNNTSSRRYVVIRSVP